MAPEKILITGADGYIGRLLAARLLQTSNHKLVLWLRYRDRESFQEKLDCLQSFLGSDRISFAAGNLVHPHPFSNLDRRQIGSIVHCAAVTRFNIDRQTAFAVNAEGAESLYRFARTCPHLERLLLVSTIYSSGLKTGTIAESGLNAKEGFANYYEESKWQAEQTLLDTYSDLPFTICRLSTIISDNDQGQVSQFNALHNTLKLFYWGLLSLMPGDPQNPIYFTTAEFAVHALQQLLSGKESVQCVNVAYKRDECLSLSEVIALAHAAFMQDQNFRHRAILKPLFCSQDHFDLLSNTLAGLNQGVLSQSIGSIAPFAAQLFKDKHIDNHNLVHLTGQYTRPDAKALFKKTLSWLILSRWGKGVAYANA